MQIVDVRDVARELRGMRRRYMLGQAQVARAVGVTRQWVSAAEKGKATLELGLVLRAFDELGLDLTATRRENPPKWTLPLTAEAEHRERSSINRLRRKRMAARDAAWAIREGNVVQEPAGRRLVDRMPDGREMDDWDYYNRIMEMREVRGAKPVIVKPAKDKR